MRRVLCTAAAIGLLLTGCTSPQSQASDPSASSVAPAATPSIRMISPDDDTFGGVDMLNLHIEIPKHAADGIRVQTTDPNLGVLNMKVMLPGALIDDEAYASTSRPGITGYRNTSFQDGVAVSDDGAVSFLVALPNSKAPEEFDYTLVGLPSGSLIEQITGGWVAISTPHGVSLAFDPIISDANKAQFTAQLMSNGYDGFSLVANHVDRVGPHPYYGQFVWKSYSLQAFHDAVATCEGSDALAADSLKWQKHGQVWARMVSKQRLCVQGKLL